MNFCRSAISRSFSASPRETIASNILKFQAISGASTDAALETAVKSAYKIDVSNLPAELQSLERYLAQAPAAGFAKFQKDPTAWQNLSIGAFIQEEVQREDTWPFVVGIV